MSSYPVPLDNLISYVKTRHPDADALQNLSDAVAVAARLDEQSDALIGHFVDQARRSGASWSQIGTSMGVSKQAAQQRFVPRREDGRPDLSRLTPRCRGALAAAGRLAIGSGANRTSAAHIIAGLLSEPDALGAKFIHDAGITDDQLCRALAVDPRQSAADAEPDRLRDIGFTGSGQAVIDGATKAVLRLGHNYFGTEHLLLGALIAGGEDAARLNEMGLTVEGVEHALHEEFKRMRAQRQPGA
ncbi:MAG TPA: Clp protease N-terminal domain-containing protein [Streptosporangiaceae bacterium]|jgi:ATP-dependent Clp protease ATP-binding subunit ClpA